jgi:hypothetical protein
MRLSFVIRHVTQKELVGLPSQGQTLYLRTQSSTGRTHREVGRFGRRRQSTNLTQQQQWPKKDPVINDFYGRDIAGKRSADGFAKIGIIVGPNKGHKVTPRESRVRISRTKGRISKKVAFVREVVKEVAGYVGTEIEGWGTTG